MDKSIIDYCMLHEDDLRWSIYAAKNDRNKCSSGPKNAISNPTEAEALWNISRLKKVLVNNLVVVDYPEYLVAAIRYARVYYNNKKIGRIFRARYIDKEDYLYTCARLGMPTSTYYYQRDKILEYVNKEMERLQC